MNTLKTAKRKAPKKVLVLLAPTKPIPRRIDSWYVQGWLKYPKGKLLTCYGLSQEETWELVEHLLVSKLCKRIVRGHTWKDSPSGKWHKEEFEV